MSSRPPHWWQTTTIYQIYPRSFQDADDDGVGDLKGIIRRVPYLKSLGIGAVWISPFYPSPMKDFGYDISDYCGVDPLFGTMDDFDALLLELHRSGLKLILDFVPNHSSDQHPWFKASRASRNNDFRDWYIWRDGAPGGGPPNNWLSEFGGEAWTCDAATGQYYHHAFLPEQPDLNWRNPHVRAAMHEAMRFWLRKGVDGFRVDVMWHLMKDADFRDNPPNPRYAPTRPPHEKLLNVYSADVDDVHEVVRGLRGVIDEFDDRLLIGEIYLPFDRLVTYYGTALDGAHLPFNFSLLRATWTADEVAKLIRAYEASLPEGAWPNWILGNHDRPRVATRVGVAQARIAALLLLTLRGTPTLYYGDEIGLPHVPIPQNRIRDPFELRVPGKGVGRDGARTPMQWSAAANAGFSVSDPWLPLDQDWRTNNVETLERVPNSLPQFYRRLLAFRHSSAVLQLGQYREMLADQNVLVFVREIGDDWLMVALNFGDRAARVQPAPRAGSVVFGTHDRPPDDEVSGAIMLRPNEGIVVTRSGNQLLP